MIQEPQESKELRKEEVRKIIKGAIMSPFVIWAVIHVVNTRGFQSTFFSSLYISIPFSVLFIIISIVEKATSREQFKFRMPSITILLEWIGITLGLIVIGLSFYIAFASLKDVYLWLQDYEGARITKVSIAIILTAIIGILLFFFRLTARSLYGASEALVGLGIAATKVGAVDVEFSNSNFLLTLLTAAVYLVVRGLDNIYIGLTKEPLDPIVTKYFPGIRGILDLSLLKRAQKRLIDTDPETNKTPN
jgi:hypothetical protein